VYGAFSDLLTMDLAAPPMAEVLDRSRLAVACFLGADDNGFGLTQNTTTVIVRVRGRDDPRGV